MNKLVYLASPYTHKNYLTMKTRWIKVCKLSAILLKRGIHNICPIASSHPTAKYGHITGTEWKDWEALDLNYLRRCDEIWISTLDKSWIDSVGMKAELEFAMRNRIPAKLVTQEGVVLDYTAREILKMFKKEKEVV